jgi:predicted MFS family arabinose efflux permease
MGCYLTVLATGMSGGALLWGQVAGAIGLAATQWIAAAAMVLASILSLRFRLDRADAAA